MNMTFKHIPVTTQERGNPQPRRNRVLAQSIALALFAGSSVMPTISFSEQVTNPKPVQEINYADLNTWQQQGPSKNGDWKVSSDGKFVEQTINGSPTFFVSPNNFLNGTIRGSFEVYTDGDDDFIGFVMGYKSPISELGHPESHNTYLLFDWKQKEQYVKEYGVTGKAGYNLVQTSNFVGFNTHCFWGHKNEPPSCNVLATNYGSDKGWQDNTKYWFELSYRTDRVIIKVGENPDNLSTIFDIEGSFEPGRFGFYNHSQENVRYGEYTYQGDPPSAETDSYNVDEGTILTVSAAEGVLANDSGVTLGELSVELGETTVHGSLSLNANGSFTYTPASNFYGSDSFTYRAFDGTQYSEYATVNITVNPLPDLTASDFQYDYQKSALNARIENIGNAPSSEALVAFYLGDPKAEGKLIGSVTVGDIESAQFKNVVLESVENLPETVELYVAVDTDNQVRESNETNNVVSQTMTIAYCRAFGKVLDKDGNPIADVTMQMDDKTTVTDATGYWEITGLPENNYTLTASKPGYFFDSKEFFVGPQECNVDLKKLKGTSLLKVKVVPHTWDAVKQGESLTYTVTITNEGSETATNVTLADILPAGSELVSIEAQDGGSCEANPVSCSLPDLTPGATARVEMVVRHTQAGNLVNAVTVKTNEYPAEIQKTWKTVTPHLSVSISDTPDPVEMLKVLHYTLDVELSHYAQNPATGVQLVSILPKGVKLDSISTDYGSCDTSQMPLITCSLTDLSIDNAGDVSHVTVNMDVTLDDPGLLLLTHEAKVTANEYPAHTDRERTTVSIPDGVEVDLAFVIDVTGSMQEEINGVKKAMTEVINQVDPNDIPLSALVVFRDNVTISAFTTDMKVLQEAVDDLEASGGGSCPEAAVEALKIAIPHTKADGNILFATDASPYDDADVEGVIELLRSKGIRFNALITGDCTHEDSWNELPN